MTGVEKFGIVVNSLMYLGFATWLLWRPAHWVAARVGRTWRRSSLVTRRDQRQAVERVRAECAAAEADINEIAMAAAQQMRWAYIAQTVARDVAAEFRRTR